MILGALVGKTEFPLGRPVVFKGLRKGRKKDCSKKPANFGISHGLKKKGRLEQRVREVSRILGGRQAIATKKHSKLRSLVSPQ